MIGPLRRIRAAVVLAAIFLWDLVAASLDVARIVLMPRVRTSPAVVVVPITLTRPAAITLLAYFVSLTPGSTCLHVSRDGTRMFVHILDTSDPTATVARFTSHFERWIAELLE